MRRGLGIGRGKGYKNLILLDKSVHQDSGRGIKQPQRIMLPVRIIISPVRRANRLPVQIGFIVPSKNKKGDRITEAQFGRRIENEQKWFGARFDGDTSFKTEGGYVTKKKRIKEDTVLITSSTSVERFEEKKKELFTHIRQRRKQWNQDSVFLRIEGQDYIYPRKKFLADDKEQSNDIIVQ